jgi:RNA polymerase sigma factor (sigma-70 family)
MTMPAVAYGPPEPASRTWSDTRLVSECLAGNDTAWAALIQKYKALIYSIPRRYGASPEDAGDIFQAVCIELFSELPRLRRSGALRAWLITVTVHHAFHWKRRHVRTIAREQGTPAGDTLFVAEEPIVDAMARAEQEQQVRDAIAHLPPRCGSLIRMLFFEQPPIRYRDAACRLGVADGSIGFLRARCLKRLRRLLKGVELDRAS